MHKYTKNPAAQLESFKAELHVMRFNHPNIVKVLAATHIDQFDDGAWVVMEYIGKSSLNVSCCFTSYLPLQKMVLVMTYDNHINARRSFFY